MEKAKITIGQLYVLMVLYSLGSSSILGFGVEAKQDAWICIIISCIISILLFLLYGIIIKKYPKLTLINILSKIFGKTLGKIIAFIYITYFMFYGSILIRDVIELLSLYIMTETPPIVLALVSAVIITYASYLGIETIARFGILVFIVTIPTKILFITSTYISGIVDFQNILPVLENGWKPIILASIPLITTTPFGQMFIFLMLLPYVNSERNKTIKAGILAILTSGLILLIITVTNILTLGTFYMEIAPFPTIQTLRLVNILNFIQRIEGLAVFTFLTSSYMKGIIYIYTAAIGLNTLFKTKKYQYYIIPTIIITLIVSFIYSENISTHLENRTKFIPTYVNPIFEILIPFIIIIIIIISKQFQKKIPT